MCVLLGIRELYVPRPEWEISTECNTIWSSHYHVVYTLKIAVLLRPRQLQSNCIFHLGFSSAQQLFSSKKMNRVFLFLVYVVFCIKPEAKCTRRRSRRDVMAGFSPFTGFSKTNKREANDVSVRNYSSGIEMW